MPTVAEPAPSSRRRGPYRPGDETRRALLNSALMLFGRQGFEATSTRAIAAAAGVALPAIGYHFGGKDALHLACADEVVARYEAAMLPQVEGLLEALPAMDAEGARDALRAITALLVRHLLSAITAEEPWIAFMVREMSADGPAHRRLYERLWEPGLALTATLVARVRGRTEAAEADRLDALMLLSTPSVFGYALPVTTRFGGWPSLPASLEAAMAARLSASIDRL